MKCIYYTEGKCNSGFSDIAEYTPDSKDKSNYCESTDFTFCPRYKSILELQKARK